MPSLLPFLINNNTLVDRLLTRNTSQTQIILMTLPNLQYSLVIIQSFLNVHIIEIADEVTYTTLFLVVDFFG